MMKRVMLIFGTRPEAVKMGPLVMELKKHATLEVVVCVTGQHRHLLDQVLDIFKIIPDFNLSVMQENQSLFDLTAKALSRLQQVLQSTTPDLILVQGDTTSALAGALAGFYLRIPVGHVEAGLRTFDLDSPYPEEFNRRAISLISSYDFAPTERARANLLAEGKKPECIFVTGNTVIDALKTTIRPNYSHPELDWARGHKLILLTAHRQENIGRPLDDIFKAIKRVARERPDIRVVFPIHPNPAIRKTAQAVLGRIQNIHIIEPLDIIDFHNFLKRSHLILTDSGGIQEEATYLGLPALVLRETTERPEGLAAGTLKLAGTSEASVYAAFTNLLDDENEDRKMKAASDIYGDGQAARRTARIITANILRASS